MNYTFHYFLFQTNIACVLIPALRQKKNIKNAQYCRNLIFVSLLVINLTIHR